VSEVIPLHRLKPGKRAQVTELASRSAARLDRLGALGLMPGTWIVVLQRRPALVLRIGETEISVDRSVAEEIFVRVP